MKLVGFEIRVNLQTGSLNRMRQSFRLLSPTAETIVSIMRMANKAAFSRANRERFRRCGH